MKNGAIASNNSLLKAGKTFGIKMRNRCDVGITDDARHIILQCPYFESSRIEMYDEIRSLELEGAEAILYNSRELFHVLLGKYPTGVQFEVMIQFWLLEGRHIL